MGSRFPVLKRREVIEILEHNGFSALNASGTSHVTYRGTINGQVRSCTVDASIDDFSYRNRTALYFIIKTQLRISPEQFFAGHPSAAKRAGLKYRCFGTC